MRQVYYSSSFSRGNDQVSNMLEAKDIRKHVVWQQEDHYGTTFQFQKLINLIT